MGLFSRKIRYIPYPGIRPELPNVFEIVGESFNQQNISEMANWPLPGDQYLWVSLRAEPENPYDKNAIRVDWVKPDASGWLTVGHIAKSETARWHQIIASAARGTLWVWPAEIKSGSKDILGVCFRQ